VNKDVLKKLITYGSKADKGYFQYAHIVAISLNKPLIEQLRQLVNGPVWDGDIISKSNRGTLFELGLAIRVCVNGEQGYTGATYFGYTVIKTFDQIQKGEICE
jgi:hypothetical protein